MASLNEDDLKRNVTDKDTWLRFVYLVICGGAFYLSCLLVLAIAILQFLAQLFSGAAFPKLVEFGANLAAYQAELVRFMSCTSEDKPFPFSPFPTTIRTVVMPAETDLDI